jgi:polyferredoxin
MVITSVNSNVSNPAMCPFILFTDRAQKRKRIGIETTEAVRPRLPPTAE